MARKKSGDRSFFTGKLREGTFRGILAVASFIVAILLVLSAGGAAGLVGTYLFEGFTYLLGIGYYLLPVLFLALAALFVRPAEDHPTASKFIAATLFLLSALGIIDIVAHRGGIVGHLVAEPLVSLFAVYSALIVLLGIVIISILILFEAELKAESLAFWKLLSDKWKRKDDEDDELVVTGAPADDEEESEEEDEEEDEEDESEEDEDDEPKIARAPKESGEAAQGLIPAFPHIEYTPPPLSLLERDKGKPGVGDIKANANLIKRTLQNFGITVEMDEVSIGPSVTRYALKPAEGVRLSKIMSLQNNLELALAAHPVRIEAPIPGKSLVGIEVPNSTKVTVGLATMLADRGFTESKKSLMVALGRDIAGASHFANLAKMPHMLIAGATGSGKSVTIHAIVNSLLFRNSPEMMRFIMIDPKRVELTLYNSIPHLLTPVITDAKKAIMALKWAGKEMERRYNILEAEKVRDIESYHANVVTPARERKERKPGDETPEPETMPYIVIILDELADIMQTYPRELEAAIVRLAQMSRAVGIHLILSTQRPSVNVITGLIKANIPARVALQVASQIDSRTILDMSGAEKLLGAGDMLYLSGDMSKPVRLQSAFIGETEVKKVTQFIKTHTEELIPADLGLSGDPNEHGSGLSLGGDEFGDGDDDDMYEEARETVLKAGRASTSHLQRKLRIGYARAARLMDMLEERGVIGPQDGARPREVIGASESSSEEGENA